MIEWATHHKGDPPPPEDDEFKEKKLDEIDPWDLGFLKVDQGTLFELILVRLGYLYVHMCGCGSVHVDKCNSVRACGVCGVHFWSELHLAVVVDNGIRSMQVLCRVSTPYLISCVLLTDTPCKRVSWGIVYSFPGLTPPLRHEGCRWGCVW